MNRTAHLNFSSLLEQASFRRGLIFGSILLLALLSFEVFNFSTTDFALTDLLGADLKFLGVRWATVLSIAFCGMDFAGIARIFTPEQGADEPVEVWYLFGAWILAAAMNASLTWWGVSVAVRTHQVAGTLVMSGATVQKIVPIFVAAMVWLIRILLIGTFSIAGERLFSLAEVRQTVRNVQRAARKPSTQTGYRRTPQPRPLAAAPQRQPVQRTASRPEPTYHPVGMEAAAPEVPNNNWRRR